MLFSVLVLAVASLDDADRTRSLRALVKAGDLQTVERLLSQGILHPDEETGTRTQQWTPLGVDEGRTLQKMMPRAART